MSHLRTHADSQVALMGSEMGPSARFNSCLGPQVGPWPGLWVLVRDRRAVFGLIWPPRFPVVRGPLNEPVILVNHGFGCQAVQGGLMPKEFSLFEFFDKPLFLKFCQRPRNGGSAKPQPFACVAQRQLEPVIVEALVPGAQLAPNFDRCGRQTSPCRAFPKLVKNCCALRPLVAASVS